MNWIGAEVPPREEIRDRLSATPGKLRLDLESECEMTTLALWMILLANMSAEETLLKGRGPE